MFKSNKNVRQMSLIGVLSSACLSLMVGSAAAADTCASAINDKGYNFRLSSAQSATITNHQKVDGGYQEIKTLVKDGNTFVSKALYSHPLLVIMREFGENTFVTSYPDGGADLNLLPDNKRFDTAFKMFVGEEFIANGKKQIEFLGQESVTIGDCTYKDVWKVRDTTVIDELVPIVIEKYYASDLELVIRSVVIDAAGNIKSDTSYDKIENE